MTLICFWRMGLNLWCNTTVLLAYTKSLNYILNARFTIEVSIIKKWNKNHIETDVGCFFNDQKNKLLQVVHMFSLWLLKTLKWKSSIASNIVDKVKNIRKTLMQYTVRQNYSTDHSWLCMRWVWLSQFNKTFVKSTDWKKMRSIEF